MSVPSTFTILNESGTGTKTTFHGTFRIFDETDLLVYFVDHDTGKEELQTTGYTVTISAVDNTFTIEFDSAPADTVNVVAYPNVANDQTLAIGTRVKYRENQLMTALDKAMICIQVLTDKLRRSILFPASATTFNGALPAPIVPGRALVINSSGTGVDYSGSDLTDLDDAVAAVSAASVAAIAAQAAAELAETNAETAETNAAISSAAAAAIQASLNIPDIATSTAGDLLQVNAGKTAYEFTSPGVGADKIVRLDAAGKLPAIDGSRLTHVVQIVNSTVSNVITCSTALPVDDTIPQNTEGTEVTTVTITPRSAANILIIEAIVIASEPGSGKAYGSLALFQDSTANALAAVTQIIDNLGTAILTLQHVMVAGTTLATTFKIRAGRLTSTLYVNGDSSGTRFFGGKCNSGITVREYVP